MVSTILVIVQVVLLVCWYLVPDFAVVPWWIILIPAWVFVGRLVLVAAIFALAVLLGGA